MFEGYHAFDTTHKVAFKNFSGKISQAMKTKVYNERDNLAMLDHPNILRLLDFYESNQLEDKKKNSQS